MIYFLLIFFGIGLISAALIAISAGYQDKDFEKAYKLCQTGISIAILDLLALLIIGIILMFI
jgi:Na+-driven multidrug efflux pump